MSFPETRRTLIFRLASGGHDADWERLLADYWRPIVLFTQRSASMPFDQAEDVAAETFLVLVQSSLLARWQSAPSAKFRSLLCGVARNVIANRQRLDKGRRRILREIVEAGGVPDLLPVHDSPEPVTSDVDAFYRAWVDDLLSQSLRAVLSELYAEGRGDYFRALYGRLCEGLSAAELGQALGLPPATIENYLRVAKSRLARSLQRAVRQHVERYSAAAETEQEIEREWNQLQQFLEQFGGLETAIRQEAARAECLPGKSQPSKLFLAVKRVTHNSN
jgi:RNA polymerase sigma factor (sigma-70 family)